MAVNEGELDRLREETKQGALLLFSSHQRLAFMAADGTELVQLSPPALQAVDAFIAHDEQAMTALVGRPGIRVLGANQTAVGKHYWRFWAFVRYLKLRYGNANGGFLHQEADVPQPNYLA